MSDQADAPERPFRLIPEGITAKFIQGPLKGLTATGVFRIGKDIVITNPHGLENVSSPVRPVVVMAVLHPDDTVELVYG